MAAYTGSVSNYAGATAAATSIMQDASSGGMPGMANPALSLPTGGIRTAFHTGVAPAPVAKKPRQEEMQQFQGMQGGQVFGHPGHVFQQNQQHTMQQMMQPQQQTSAGLSLPVGVGIRLGGPGGIAPSTAQQAARAQQAQYVWGQNPSGGGNEAAVVERRQRNREHAKRSRVRKKFMLESLQGEVRELQKENQTLRMLVQEHIPDQAMNIISECCTTSPLFADEDGADGKPSAEGENLSRSDMTLMQSLTTGQQCFVLSDPKLPDNPIVFASPGFYKLTGYTSKEVLGRNCRFLQGPGTNPKAVDVIRKAVASGTDATVCLLNYKADGTPFWNQFFIAALRDSDNNIVNYVSAW